MNRPSVIVLLSVLTLGVMGCTSEGGGGTVVCSLPKDEVPQTYTKVSKQPDLSGRVRVGKASFYAASFYHHEMADGTKMDPQGLNAASLTLPLGTTAKVTNLVTGQSAIVHIQDRGPYVKGRIVDLSPAVARRIGITQRMGVAPVKVTPIAVPLPDGTVKAGPELVHSLCRSI